MILKNILLHLLQCHCFAFHSPYTTSFYCVLRILKFITFLSDSKFHLSRPSSTICSSHGNIKYGSFPVEAERSYETCGNENYAAKKSDVLPGGVPERPGFLKKSFSKAWDAGMGKRVFRARRTTDPGSARLWTEKSGHSPCSVTICGLFCSANRRKNTSRSKT